MHNAQRGLLLLVAVGNQARHQIHHEPGDAAMPTVLNLADVLQLVIDRLDQRPLPQHQLLPQRHQAVFHVLADLGHQFQTLRMQRLG